MTRDDDTSPEKLFKGEVVLRQSLATVEESVKAISRSQEAILVAQSSRERIK